MKMQLNDYHHMLTRTGNEYINERLNERIYITENTKKLALIFIDLLKQKLQEDIIFDGFSCFSGTVSVRLKTQIGNFTVRTNIIMSMRDKGISLWYEFINKSTDIGSTPWGIEGTQDEFDTIFCMICLQSILPLEDTYVLKA